MDDGGTFRVDLTYHIGAGPTDSDRLVRAAQALAEGLPPGSRIVSVGDAPTGDPDLVEVVASVPTRGGSVSAAQALRDVARAVEMGAIAAAGADNLGQCRSATVERLPDA